LTKNTVIVTEVGMMVKLVNMPPPLRKCERLGCYHSRRKPVVEKIGWFPAECNLFSWESGTKKKDGILSSVDWQDVRIEHGAPGDGY